MRPYVVLAALGLLAPLAAHAQADQPSLERGRYIAVIGGCNDCHTAGYSQAAGKLPETDWLKGNPVGYRGPWGTSYAVNLRLYMAGRTEAEWNSLSTTFQTRPPMPWPSVHAMTEVDRVSLYRFIRALPGDMGNPAPDAAAPGQEPSAPYVVFAPPTLPRH